MPAAPHFNDPQHRRQRAEEARVLTEQITVERARKMMLGIAVDYDQLAVPASIRLTYLENSGQSKAPIRGSHPQLGRRMVA
jgi:hypothetical protein